MHVAGSSLQRTFDGGSWRLDTLKEVFSSTSREVGVVRIAVISVLSPLIVPTLLGGPLIVQGFLPLLEGGW